jgi:hypothetical protein
MNSTGQNREKTGYRVVLLLVVGLTAFSSAMKELNQIQQFTLDASRLIAQWSEQIAPTEIQPTVVKLETCDSNLPPQQSLPSVELPWLDRETVSSAVAPVRVQQMNVRKNLPKAGGVQIARLKKIPQMDINPFEFEVRLLADHDERAEAVTFEVPVSTFVTPNKTKSRKHRVIRINPRDREILLKTLNRSINLRSAS